MVIYLQQLQLYFFFMGILLDYFYHDVVLQQNFCFIVTETTSHFIFDLNFLNNFSLELPEYYELSLALHGLFGLDEEIKSLLELIHFWLEAFNNSDIILASLTLSEVFLLLMEEHIINYCLICAFVIWVCVCVNAHMHVCMCMFYLYKKT